MSRSTGRAPLTATVALLLLIAGCAVDQNEEIQLYRTVIDSPPLTINTSPNELEPLTLDDVLRLASANNETLAIQGETYLQSLIDRKRAVAAFLPTISLSPTYFMRDPPGNGAEFGAGGTRNQRLDVPVTGSMNLFRGFGDIANLRATEATIEQQRALLLDFQQSLLIDVAQTFFAILRAERSAEVLRDSIAVQEERVRDIRARQEAGLARLVDVAQTEAQASETRVALIRAENDIRNGRELLSLLIAAPVGDRALIGRTEVPEPLEPIESIEALALEHRQDLLAALRAIDAAQQDVQAAYGQYWPSISVNASYLLSRQTAPTDSDWTALFTASLPLFSAGLIEADVRTALSRLRQAKLAESFTRRAIMQQVRIAFEDLHSSRRRLTELKTTVAAAEQALQQADDDLRVGRGTVLERIIAQNQLLAAQLQMASEEFDQKIAYLTLLRTAGVLERVIQMPDGPEDQD